MTVARHAVSRLGLALASFLLIPLALAAAPSAERQAKLDHLLLQDCGSCHGLRMTGGLGPALTRDALAGKPRDSLVATVTHGRPGTAMPGWNALLDEQERARAAAGGQPALGDGDCRGGIPGGMLGGR